MSERYFFPSAPSSSSILLRGEEAHHLLQVKRAQPGEKVILFDGQGTEYHCTLVRGQSQSAQLEIGQRIFAPGVFPLEITIAQGLLKIKAWELLLQKAMELGLARLVPLTCQHLALGPHTAGKHQRWQKILIAAAKQCGRNQLLEISPPLTLHEVLGSSWANGAKLLARPDAAVPSLQAVLQPKRPQRILVFVGPEGGFSTAEETLLENAGVVSFCLGQRTLRAETAALVVMANLAFYYEGGGKDGA